MCSFALLQFKFEAFKEYLANEVDWKACLFQNPFYFHPKDF